VRDDAHQHPFAADVNDQRIERRPRLDLENARDRGGIERVRS